MKYMFLVNYMYIIMCASWILSQISSALRKYAQLDILILVYWPKYIYIYNGIYTSMIYTPSPKIIYHYMWCSLFKEVDVKDGNFRSIVLM